MEILLEVTLTLIVAALLSYGGWRTGLFTKDGSAMAFVTGIIVGIFGGLDWFILLMVFTLAGLIATKAHYKDKVEKGLQEGKKGERTYRNVLGVGIPPCAIAVITFLLDGQYHDLMTVAFVSSLAVAAADTIASEIGTKDGRVWMITTGERIEPGINGGVSVLGTAASLLAAFLFSIFAWLMVFGTLNIYILIPTAAGMIGNILDSVIGATLENNGHISKYGNNCVTSVIGAIIGILLSLAL